MIILSCILQAAI